MSSGFCIILVSCPDDGTADDLAEGLIGRGLAACVNILPGILSVYRWEGRVERARERLLLIKSRSDGFDAVRDYVVAHHSYDLPEIIAVPIDAGLPGYLDWIDASVTQ